MTIINAQKWDKNELEELYWEQKLSTLQIAEIKGVSDQTIYRQMKKLGVKRRSRSEAYKLMYSEGRRDTSSTKNPNWKGGRYKNSEGYVLIHRADHPRADANKMVREHIVVWEATNKRSLPKGFIIHHLNGIRDDNRPENLVALPRKRHDGIKYSYQKLLQKRIRELEERLRRLEKETTKQ